MAELDSAGLGSSQAYRPRQLNPIDAAVGVIVRPVTAMREIATARPWLTALVLSMAITLLTGLANLTASTSLTSPAPPELPGGELLPVELQSALEGYQVLAQSPALIVANALVLSPLLLIIWTGLLFLVSRLLRGRAPFTGLLATQSFASVPAILLAPVSALANLGGGALLALLGGVLGFGVALWTLVLQVIGIRESQAFSTGRAVAALLISIVIVVIVLTIVVGMAVAIVLTAVLGT